MSSYPPPSELLPIYNASTFTYEATPLTIATADLRYVQLTGNETISGEKSFLDPIIGTSATFTSAISVGNFSTTVGTIIFNNFDSGNTYQGYVRGGNGAGIFNITLPALSGTVALTNATQTVSGNQTFTGQTYCRDTSTNFQLTRSLKGSATAVAGSLTFSINADLGGDSDFGSVGGVYLVNVALRSSDFNVSRAAFTAIVEASFFAGGKYGMYVVSSNNVSASSINGSTGVVSLTITAATGATYEITQTQIGF